MLEDAQAGIAAAKAAEMKVIPADRKRTLINYDARISNLSEILISDIKKKRKI